MSGYIGTQPVPQATQTRDSFTATSGQTSFATGGYTPNFLDVYLNGVKLASADYTATNGSDVVLASGAATGDILEVVAYTAFDTANVTGATNFTVTGAFTSQGIDDNGNATAITIDGNENVMLGNTVANPASGFASQAGFGYTASTGVVEVATTANTAPMEIGKNNANDGQLIALRKQGSTVGSIGTQSGKLQIDGSSGTGFWLDTTQILPKVNSSLADNQADLGSNSYRFKDAYLSGGVYLGGTGSANYLDSYEEGTWNPVLSGTSGNATMGTGTVGFYTKVGNLVHVTGTMIISGNGNNANNTTKITGMPFAVNGNGGARQIGVIGAWTGCNDSEKITLVADPSNTFMYVIRKLNNTYAHSNSFATTANLYGFSLVYQTA